MQLDVYVICIILRIGSKLDILANNYRIVYKETRCQPVRDQWPPNQPSTIVNVALIHHEGEPTQQELIDMSLRNVSSVEELSSQHPRVTKRIADIFRSTHKRILIEGAPGIGKTVLAKEIAYCWANGEILTSMKLFLLVIRDPNLHCVNSISKLVHYLNDDYLSDSEVEVAVDELRKSKGSGIAFVFDGYDECPSDSKLKDFVDKLIERKYLPMCMIVITSRPNASLLLRHLVNQRIEVLGLAKKEQDQYILESLKGSEMCIKLQEYLKQQPIINSLIYVPLYLAILLYLFKQKNALPETLTEMNEYFIIHTIYRHLRKQRQLSYLKIETITDLLEPERTTLYKLSKLAYKGLRSNQLVFTYDEMKEVCAEIDKSDIHGFGLMQTVECYCHKGAGKSISLNFLHFTMQEYLAALHVSSLPSEEQLLLIEKLFWDRQFNFMWIMYIGIVGTQLTSFIKSVIFKPLDEQQNHTLHDGEYNILARKNLFLFQCCLEGKDVTLIAKAINTIFSDGNINLSKVTLLPHHIMSLTVFMMRSTTQWKSLNLNSCSIGNNGMSILAKFLKEFKERVITIKYINLRNNYLTSLCLTQDTAIDQDHTVVFGKLLQSVEELDISFNLLCDREILIISDCLKINSTLQKLTLSHNRITDEGAKALAVAIQVNTTLQELNIYSNKLSDEGAKRLAVAIPSNTTLQGINISKNLISKEGVMRILEACTKNRTLHKLVCTHNNLSKSGLAAINGYIRKENAVQIFVSSWNSLCSKNYQLAFKVNFQLLYLQQKLQSHNDVQEEIWRVDDFTEPKHVKELMQNILDDVQHVNVAGTVMTEYQMSIFCDCLITNSKLTELDLSSNGITDERVKTIIKALQVNMSLLSFNISCNKICDEGITSISNYIKISNTLCELNLSNTEITDEGAKALAVALQVNTTLQELVISKNWISKEGVMRILEACTKNRTLHKLVCTHNNLSKSGLAAINEYIRKENAVQIFDASWNSVIASSKCGSQLVITTLQLLRWSPDGRENSLLDYNKEVWLVNNNTKRNNISCRFTHDSLVQLKFPSNFILSNDGVVAFSEYLKINTTLIELDMGRNDITYKGASRLAEAIKVNTALQSLNISYNQISDDGVIAFSECLKINTTLIELDMGCNNITYKGASRLAKAIQLNNALQKLNISFNQISDDGAIAFSECLKANTTLIELDMGINDIRYKGASRLAEAIKVNTALQSLNISYNQISDDGVIAFSECLKINTTLIELDMGCNNITYKGASRLAKAIQLNNALQKLNISFNQISDDGAIAFSECLKANTTLIELDMGINDIRYKGASRLAEAIQVNTALQRLNISYNQISDDRAIAFSEYLITNTTLIELDMGSNNITCKGASRLAEAIQVNTALQSLNISYNQISDDGAIAFSECLKTNTTLIELDMGSNNITCKGASRLAEAIQVKTALQSLNISYNQISDDGAIAFSECLKTNTTLIELDMKSNNITFKGASRLAEAIQVNTILQKLNISNNQISDDGAIAFSECLEAYTTLIELYMEGNNITCKGASRLAEAIQINTALQKLNISSNQISDDGAIAFSECLKTNTTLMELILPYNISSPILKSIEEAIRINRSNKKEIVMDTCYNTSYII